MPPDEESLGFIFLRAPRLDQEVDGAGESTQVRARSDTGIFLFPVIFIPMEGLA
jgi:hypothetical protein